MVILSLNASTCSQDHTGSGLDAGEYVSVVFLQILLTIKTEIASNLNEPFGSVVVIKHGRQVTEGSRGGDANTT